MTPGGGGGASWRDVPERHGPWQTCYERYGRWDENGIWTDPLAAIQVREDAIGNVEWILG
ncbi:transposase [Marinactinospora rubrisoli]|uniref:Transposase n=1 Tax=Marinactinospora rubrisoli TaxID=2715399 RepID=A0ABW2KHM9_9ACTN